MENNDSERDPNDPDEIGKNRDDGFDIDEPQINKEEYRLGSEFVFIERSSEDFDTVGIIEFKQTRGSTNQQYSNSTEDVEPRSELKRVEHQIKISDAMKRPFFHKQMSQMEYATYTKKQISQLELLENHKKISMSVKQPHVRKQLAEMELSNLQKRKTALLETNDAKRYVSLIDTPFDDDEYKNSADEQETPKRMDSKTREPEDMFGTRTTVSDERLHPYEIEKSKQADKDTVEREDEKGAVDDKPKISKANKVYYVDDNIKEQIVEGQSQVTFTKSNPVTKSMRRVSEILGFAAPLNTNNSILAKAQSFSLIKEKPSRDNAVIVDVAENLISLNSEEGIKVRHSLSNRVENWEVESGFNIFKSLNPVPYHFSKSKLTHQSNDDFIEEMIESREECVASEQCKEFLSPVEYADLFVTNTIYKAREIYIELIHQYGDSNKSISTTKTSPLVSSKCWSSINELTKEQGIVLIERYIVAESILDEDWKYSVFYEGAQSDRTSDYFFYVATFCLPTKLYPIAQVTASLYFEIEVSRVIPPLCPIKVRFSIEGSQHRIDPAKYTLKEKVLLRILDMKLDMFRKLRF